MKQNKIEEEQIIDGSIIDYALSIQDVREKAGSLKETVIQSANRLLILSERLNQCCHEIQSYGILPDALKESFILEKFERFNFMTTELNTLDIAYCAPFILQHLGITTEGNVDKIIGDALNSTLQDKKILPKLAFACQVLGLAHFVFHLEKNWMQKFTRFEYYLTSKSHEAIGYGTAKLERMKDSKDSQKTKKEQREIKERLVISTYLKMVNDKIDKIELKNLSENKMAQRVKERAEPELTKVKTSDGKPVLKRTIDHKGNIKYTGLSTKTIVDILRNRDKTKILFYPWENREASRT